MEVWWFELDVPQKSQALEYLVLNCWCVGRLRRCHLAGATVPLDTGFEVSKAIHQLHGVSLRFLFAVQDVSSLLLMQPCLLACCHTFLSSVVMDTYLSGTLSLK